MSIIIFFEKPRRKSPPTEQERERRSIVPLLFFLLAASIPIIPAAMTATEITPLIILGALKRLSPAFGITTY